jgi:hypothetical protein
MRPFRATAGVACGLALALAASPAMGRTQSDPADPQSAQTTKPKPAKPLVSPENLDLIREALNREPALKIENGQLRIYVQVIARWPSFAEMVKGYDLKNGPTGGGNPMSHQEFLGMVTPREMYGSSGIRPTEMLSMAIVNFLGQAVIKKGLEEIRNARSEREIAEIRARIDRELAALKGGK